jgi:hypothetical protein
MNPDAATAAQSRLARRIRLQTDGECMTLQVPCFGLSMLLGVLASVLLAAYFVFVPDAPARKPAAQQYEDLPGGGRLALSPHVEFESAESARKKEMLRSLGEWKPALLVPTGFLVFFVGNAFLRRRIVLDRGNNVLRRGKRSICALDQVLNVELDDAPRMYAMNTLALVLSGDRRVMLLYFDRSTDAGLFRKTEAIAAFLGVPLKAKMGVRPRRRNG